MVDFSSKLVEPHPLIIVIIIIIIIIIANHRHLQLWRAHRAPELC